MANTLEIVFVIDSSGSMYGSESDIIGGFNSMIQEQRKNGFEAYVSVVLFSSSSEVLYDRVKLGDVKTMTARDYITGGSTALLDALGNAIDHIKTIHKYARKEDVPTKTMFVVMTDGEENASRDYNNKQIRRLVKRQQEKYHWEFIFMGADIDAFASARRIGIRQSRTVEFTKDSDCVEECYRAVGRTMRFMSAAEDNEEIEDDVFSDLLQLFKKEDD